MLKVKILSFQKRRYVLQLKCNFRHLSVFSFAKVRRELRTRRAFDRCETLTRDARYNTYSGSKFVNQFVYQTLFVN